MGTLTDRVRTTTVWLLAAAVAVTGCASPDEPVPAAEVETPAAATLDGGVPAELAQPVPAQRPLTSRPKRELPDITDPEVQALIEQRKQERAEIRRVQSEERRARDAERREALEQARQQREERQAAASRVHGELRCDHPATRWCERAADVLAVQLPSWENLGWNVHITPERPDEWLGGLAYGELRRVEVFPQDGWTEATFDRVLLHEMGHAIDRELLTDADRRRWSAERGIGEQVAWRAGGYPHDHSAAGEDFAEVVVYAAFGFAPRSPYGTPSDELVAAWRPWLRPDLSSHDPTARTARAASAP